MPTGDLIQDTLTVNFGTGKYGGRCLVQGGHVKATSFTFATTGVWTMEFWAKMPSSAPGSAVFLLNINGAVQLVVDSGGNVNGDYYPGPPSPTSSVAGKCDGAWHYFSYQIDGTNASLYCDGTRVAHAAQGPYDATGGSMVLCIGGVDTGTGFDFLALTGSAIDEVRISNVARYSGATMTVPSSPFTPDANTLGLYHFEDTGLNSASLSVTGNTPALAESNFSAYTRTLLNGESFTQIIPNSATLNGLTLLDVHGDGGNYASVYGDQPHKDLLNALCARGYSLCAGNNGGTSTWGTVASENGLTISVNAMKELFPSHRYVFNPGSMGGIVTWNWLKNHYASISSKLVGILAIQPTYNMAYEEASTILTGTLRTAWGASDHASFITNSAGRRPEDWTDPTDAFPPVPVLIIASPSDTLVPKTQNGDALAARFVTNGASVTQYTASGEHGDPSHYLPASVWYTWMDRVAGLSKPDSSGVFRGILRGIVRGVSDK